MEQQHIDSLLERHLNLIDEYSRLQEELSKLLRGVFQNIARANFLSDRGMRYDHDHVDKRMRASRVLDVTFGEDGVPKFKTKDVNSPADDEDREDDGKREDSAEGDKADTTVQESSEASPEETQDPKDKDEDNEKQDKKKTRKTTTDPLRWFGILVPAPLRTAQTLSIRAVEQVVPRLASVSAEMKQLGIEIRRAQKKRDKAAAAAVAEKEAVGDGGC